MNESSYDKINKGNSDEECTDCFEKGQDFAKETINTHKKEYNEQESIFGKITYICNLFKKIKLSDKSIKIEDIPEYCRGIENYIQSMNPGKQNPIQRKKTFSDILKSLKDRVIKR